MTLPSFDLPSAKNMTAETAVSVFVPTPLYWQVLHADSHDVVFGTRGSGKTMLLRMLSVAHLFAYAKHEARAREALFVDRRFGLFIPLGIDWCVAYASAADGSLDLFHDGVNLVACDCLVEAIDLLIRQRVVDVDPDGVEVAVAEALSLHWFRGDVPLYSFAALRTRLLRQQAILRDVWRGLSEAPSAAVLNDAGFRFRAAPLLTPLADALVLVNPSLGLPRDHRWLVCLDELEDLKPVQVKSIRTSFRAAARTMILKITTQPYTLEEADTFFAREATAVEAREFEVRRLQHDPADPTYRELVGQILRKRVSAEPGLSGEDLGIAIFGNRTLAERATQNAPGFKQLRERLTSPLDNSDSARQHVPVVALRALREAAEGHGSSSAYAGWRTIVRASDGNPGMFVRILNAFMLEPSVVAKVPEERQHAVLVRLANTWHEWSIALYANGDILYKLVERLGQILGTRLHGRRSDGEGVPREINRFEIDLGEIDSSLTEALKVGARHALFVAETVDGSVRYPARRGVWRLSYALAPKYWLVMRRGRITKLARRQLSFEFGDVASLGDVSLLSDASDVAQVGQSSSPEDVEV